ncbi:2-succinyl-5-enolpyruvyl-6-hydroxy-3-cyclohexene-1-carboxylic-acid synthase [Corynebacterium mustelae]|uniref:2-succinyl-5-enolpyruvyl-6-hydroxy-3-cyclohexene-1-carboxylate synthase n=1 Tax=Corynebacterium mustelae TaxID=571915 RepID=A0A0G3H0X2_9CORY|nr:2-succinyl-5-enolpyruvyl-6-hydroxy-3-cyclohexene-1-carboxylic-acid synthase [Corynebacterium mustelae]AKK04712.1 2-succinyl-5-enolpyruvyl-6-hydroxy-3-cyclohexene-1-carboxylic-acid synthase [Corynebacterium mustelae]
MTFAQHSAAALAVALAEELARHITDVVICPGSRNSPLSLALIARPDVRVHSRIDERSAAFAALGMARVTGRHVGVVTTSGTAVANCLPAVVEARHAHVPLAIISADRPVDLVGTGANQTIEQRGLLTLPTIDVATVADLSMLVDAFTAPVVHINARFAEPLVAGLPLVPEPVARHNNYQLIGQVDHGVVDVDLRVRTLVIAGDEAWAVPGLEDVPTIAEPSAPTPYHPVHPLAAPVFAKTQVSAAGFVVDTKVEQVIVVGHPTLHRDVLKLVADPDVDVVVLTRTDTVTNPFRKQVRVGSRVKVTGQPTPEWLKICTAASDMAAATVREVLAEPEFGFTGLHVAAAVADTLGTGDTLFIGPSNPVRDCSLVGLPFDGVDTFTPRGVAGIDGNISQAIGVALATQARYPDQVRAPRTVAIMGDVTFVHDLGGLVSLPGSPQPENLTIVVANDNGGGIFETLEIGAEEYKPSFEQAFGTPHAVDIESLCVGFGHDYRRVETLSELVAALLDTIDSGGFTVIEALTQRDTRRQLHDVLKAKNAI